MQNVYRNIPVAKHLHKLYWIPINNTTISFTKIIQLRQACIKKYECCKKEGCISKYKHKGMYKKGINRRGRRKETTKDSKIRQTTMRCCSEKRKTINRRKENPLKVITMQFYYCILLYAINLLKNWKLQENWYVNDQDIRILYPSFTPNASGETSYDSFW